MKIRLLTYWRFRTGGGSPGDVVDVPKADAIRLIERGAAQPVRSRRQPETATPKRKAEA